MPLLWKYVYAVGIIIRWLPRPMTQWNKYVNLNWSIVSLTNGNSPLHCAISFCRKCKAIQLISERLATLSSFNCIRSAPDKRMCLMRISYAFGEFECSLQHALNCCRLRAYWTFPNCDTRIKICVNLELINWSNHIQMNIFLDRYALHKTHIRTHFIDDWES